LWWQPKSPPQISISPGQGRQHQILKSRVGHLYHIFYFQNMRSNERMHPVIVFCFQRLRKKGFEGITISIMIYIPLSLKTSNNTRRIPQSPPQITLFFFTTPSSLLPHLLRNALSAYSYSNQTYWYVVINIHRLPRLGGHKTSKSRIRRPPKIIPTVRITIKIDDILDILSRTHERRQNWSAGVHDDAICHRGSGVIGSVTGWG
jgi:hypothetical protein